MTHRGAVATSDWNAADAERDMPRPGLLARLPLGSIRSLVKKAMKEAGARPLDEEAYPRARNIVDGLATRIGLARVDVFTFEGPANAFTGRTDGAIVALSTELLESFTRTELEAVVSHCLVRFGDAGKRGARVGYSDDVRAVASTRYPPALASALQKATPYSGRFAPLYLVAEGPSHRPVAERIEGLQDL